MAATAASISRLLPGVDLARIDAYLADFGRRYLDRFSEVEIADHIGALERLAPDRPIETLLGGDPEGTLTCAVLAFDYPSEFCFIVGVLSSMGFDILEGEVFTLHPPESAKPAPAHRRDGRKIADFFSCRARRGSLTEDWKEVLAHRLGRIASILERGGKDSLRRTRREVAELASAALEEIGAPEKAALYPIEIEVDDADARFTRMRVVSRDTPFFLFAFSAALSLQGVSIEHVVIRTRGVRIEDEFDFIDVSGDKIGDAARLDRIKLTVLLAKQFTSFLGAAGDPGAALLRFEDLAAEALALPEGDSWFELLSNRSVMGDLARLLGASDFLWEDFIRLQYETLVPMLRPHAGGGDFSEPLELLPTRLAEAIEGADSEGGFVRALNEFKDREIFLFDLDHILSDSHDLLTLSERLTALAELVVGCAASYAYRTLAARHGEPSTVAGLPVGYAIMGLGKLGGAALGYASDIELLFVYGDSGSTTGPRAIENSEFFEILVRTTQSYIHAKREGIFHIDLRLRPYGDSGPLACSLESFCTYFASEGQARSYERLALVRLRAVGGDRALGERVERLRDELIYAAKGFDLSEFRSLRERQLRYKNDPAGPNAKFSPGALVDLEYAVQILQIERGAAEPRLRTPRIHEALEALESIGELEEGEARDLTAAYHFFRGLINGLRMLRGSALDLSLPPEDSEEYSHLARRIGYVAARRIGYVADGKLGPARGLRLDFEMRTAEVRAFVGRHFGQGGHLDVKALNAADLVLSESATEAARDSVLLAKGFKNPARALVNLRALSGFEGRGAERVGQGAGPVGESTRGARFARLVVLACDFLSQRPDPDMALNNWERFVDALPDPAAHLAEMLSQPKRLEILLDIFSTSQFLADALIREPALLDYISEERSLRPRREKSDIAGELASLSRASPDADTWRDELRGFRRKEILRIGARDICLGMGTRSITEELSSLADCILEAALTRIRHGAGETRGGTRRREARFCVVAFGKLGGMELNYSSDIDLLGLWDAGAGDAAGTEEWASSCMGKLRAELSDYGPEGSVYRVDLRLRPYGSSGQLVSRRDAIIEYYSTKAAIWEIQALLKARPVAGDMDLGLEFLGAARELIAADREPESVVSSICSLRREAIKKLPSDPVDALDVKSGQGGIREVEFLVQGLQLIHAHANPGLLQGNTLAGIESLSEARILPRDVADALASEYIFLRRVEHFLQIYEDRQTHRLPSDPDQIQALSRRMLGASSTEGEFRAKLDSTLEKVHGAYLEFLGGAYWEREA